MIFSLKYTVWNVSKYGVFSGPYFSAIEQNTERYEVSFRIQFKCGKIRTRKNCVFGHFSRSDSSGLLCLYLPLIEGCKHLFPQRVWQHFLLSAQLVSVKHSSFINPFSGQLWYGQNPARITKNTIQMIFNEWIKWIKWIICLAFLGILETS